MRISPLRGAVIALAAIVSATACSDRALPSAPLAAGSRRDLALVTAARVTGSLTNQVSGQCLATQAGRSSPVTPAVVAPCANTADQILDLPAPGTSGQVFMFAGSLCLDDFGAAGRTGDIVGVYTCVNGAATQSWTLTASGALTGVNGLCVGVSGSSVTLQNCDGSSGQRWGPASAAAPPVVGGSLVSAGGLCLGTKDHHSAALTPSAVASCDPGMVDQVMTLPPPRSAGQMLLFNATMCLDDFGAAGRVNDVVGVYTCVSGAPSQQWTLTSTGTIVGANGLCVAVTGSNVTLQTCTGSHDQQWSVGQNPVASPPGRVAAALASAAGSCLATRNGASTPGTPSTLAPCGAGAPDEILSIPAVGNAGQVLLFNRSMCLDDFGAAGRVGDVVGVYICVPGAPSQSWSLTQAGALVGIHGLCVTSMSSSVTLQTCDGGVAQKWSVSLPAASPVLDPAGAVFAFLGRVPSVADIQARGGAWAKYEADFSSFVESHWVSDGASYDNANYYDRAMIYYVWWARTGNATYLDRANQLALNARAYFESLNYLPQPYLMMLDGVVLHALVTGDQQSRLTVGKVADAFIGPASWPSIVGDSTMPGLDSRTQARVLTAVLDAWYLKAPSGAGTDWAASLRDLLTKILATQGSDGAYRWPAQCGYNKPFMNGILNDVLIRYYYTFEPDPRIVPAVKRAVDYMWANDWVASAQGFTYIDGPCQSELPSAAADLNNLIVSAFAFVGKSTGDAGYFAKADAIFAGGVNDAWLAGSKQFNQEYASSFRYLGLRW